MADPMRFDWRDGRIVMGHAWLLLAGFTWALAMLGVPLVGILSSVFLVSEPITAPLALGTALVIAGIAVAILDRSRG